MGTLSLGAALHAGWSYFWVWMGANNLNGESALQMVDDYKNMLADSLGVSHAPEISYYLYPASVYIWSELGSLTKRAPMGAAFPDTIFINGLRLRGITPMILWSPQGSFGTRTITNISVASDAVFTVSQAHPFEVGDVLTISGTNCTPTANGARTVTAVPSGLTFQVGLNVTSAGSAGSAYKPFNQVSVWQNWVNGQYDDYLDTWAQEAIAWKNDNYGGWTYGRTPQANTIIFRIAQEQNGNWFHWSVGGFDDAQGHHNTGNTQNTFINGFRHIHDRIRNTNGANHVQFLYSPQATISGDRTAGYGASQKAQYPGDAWVEYNGYDAYTSWSGGLPTPFIPGTDLNSWQLHSPIMDWCRTFSNRPIIIGETAVGGGGADDTAGLPTASYPGTGAQRAQWFTGNSNQNMTSFRNNYPELRGFTYFNIDVSISGTPPNWMVDRNQEAIDAIAVWANMNQGRYGQEG